MRSDSNTPPPVGLAQGSDLLSIDSHSVPDRGAFLTLRRTVSYPPMDETQMVSELVQRGCVQGEEIFTNPPVQSCASPLAMRRGMSL